LLIAQNKKHEAIARLEAFSKNLKTEPIKDDVHWLEANMRLEQGEFEKAISLCEKIVTEFADDVLADDAYFLQGEINERYLYNKEKAMEIYRDFLNRYPGSVFVAEARKRFRTLRGDFVDIPVN
jgi:TolA-binding protein